MIIINDNSKCTCGAYWQSCGYCCNGHPKGVLTMPDLKDLKRQLRALKKLKKLAPVGSEHRKQINKEIRALKKEKQAVDVPLVLTEEKQILIEELNQLYELKGRPFLVDFRLYSEAQLKIHLNKMRGNLT
jgi:hypothetical protein